MAVRESNRKQFIETLLKTVKTDDDRKILSELISSSLVTLSKDTKSEASSNAWIHSPHKVNQFLRKFSTNAVLKFAVHTWDSGEFSSYNDFIDKISLTLNEDPTYKNMYLYNIGLNYSLRDFLQTNTTKPLFSWLPGEHIEVGLRYPEADIQKWMDQNPGKDIMSMPLSALPEKHRPTKRYNNKSLVYMEDVCELFKHVVEFRNNDFERLIRTAFKSSDYTPDIDESVTGISFYTYTPSVKTALSYIAQNIRERILNGAPSAVKIFVDRNEDNTLDLHIQHIGSYADCEILRPKLRDGTLASLRLHVKSSLLSVCDYSVKSRFRSEDGNMNNYIISYLYPNAEGNAAGPEVKFEKTDEVVDGFEYILRFYK